MNKWGDRLFLLIIALAIPNPVSTVQSGTRGVLTTFGKVGPAPLEKGIHFVMPPVSRVHVLDVRLQKIEGKGVAASADLQQGQIAAPLNGRLDTALVNVTFQKIWQSGCGGFARDRAGVEGGDESGFSAIHRRRIDHQTH